MEDLHNRQGFVAYSTSLVVTSDIISRLRQNKALLRKGLNTYISAPFSSSALLNRRRQMSWITIEIR